MRLLRAALAVAAVGLSVMAAPSHAFPPVLVTGEGTLSPGLSLALDTQAINFEGSAQDFVLQQVHLCHLTGTAIVASSAWAFGIVDGRCGPYQYQQCLFWFTPTTWDLACTNGAAGKFAVSFLDANPTTRFSATGVLT